RRLRPAPPGARGRLVAAVPVRGASDGRHGRLLDGRGCAGRAYLRRRALRGPAAGGAAVQGIVRPARAGRRRRVESGDLPAAREALRALCSRDPSQLDAEALLAAAIQSLAENASDSFVAPLFYFSLFGVPGAIPYRA